MPNWACVLKFWPEIVCTTAGLLMVLNPSTSTAEDPLVEMRLEEVGLYCRASQDPCYAKAKKSQRRVERESLFVEGRGEGFVKVFC